MELYYCLEAGAICQSDASQLVFYSRNITHKKEICRHYCRHYPSTISVFRPRSGAGNLTAAQAPGTDVHVTGSSLNDCLNAFYIGFPGTVASSVRVADLNAKGDIFSAKFTSGHCCTSLPCAMGISAKSALPMRTPIYNNRRKHKMQVEIQIIFNFFSCRYKKCPAAPKIHIPLAHRPSFG